MKKIKFFSIGLLISVLFLFNNHSVAARDSIIPAPSIPQVTGVEVVKTTSSAITLHWDPVPLVEGYEIDVVQNNTTIQTIRTKKTTKTIPELEADTTYTFQVLARIGDEYGEASDELEATTKAAITVPFDPDTMIANQLIVKMQKGKKLNIDYPKEKLLISKYTKHKYVFVKIKDKADPDTVIAKLLKLPGVISIEYNGIYELDTVTPNDEYYSDNPSKATYGWQHLGNYEYGEDGIATFNNEAWDHQTGSKDIVIAIIDSGIDTDNPDLQGNIWVNPGEIAGNGLDDDNNGFIDDINGWDFANNEADPNPNLDGMDNDGNGYVDDKASHGTSVDGSLAPLGNNTTGVVGPMWGASIMALQTNTNGDGGMNTTAIVNSISYAIANGANIINMSFGSTTNNNSLSSAVSAAADAGIFLIASAGNDPNMDLNVTPRYPVCYDRVLGVSGYSLDGQAPYYTYGSNCVDLVAPADHIKTTSIDISTGQPKYVNTSGTSFAAPIVSGIAGLLLSEKNTLTRQEITTILVATVTKQENITEDYGAGLVNGGAALAGANCLNGDGSVKTVNVYYIDADGDGYGTDDIEYSCSTSAPTNTSTNTTDCNDADKSVNANQTYYKDTDGDGMGTASSTTKVCSSTAPSGYVSNSSDKNDSDYDNDGTSTNSDCNDKDSSISKNKTYYKDTDADGLGNPNSTTSTCSSTAPSGYVSNSNDTNDSDYDNDGVSTSNDCNDKDNSISSNQTYYKDGDGDGVGVGATTTSVCSNTAPSGYVTKATDCNDSDNAITSYQTYYIDSDGDGLGNPAISVSVCSTAAPNGYVGNSSDTDDTINTDNVEVGDDGEDNDGDGKTDEPNTPEENGTNNLYSDNNPADKEVYAASVMAIDGRKNGKIKVTYSDQSEYIYKIFDVDTDTTTAVKSFNDTGYLIVLHPKAKTLALVNVYNGEIFETETISDQKWKGKSLKLKDLREDGSTEAIVTGKKDTDVLVTILKVNPDKSNKLGIKDNIKVQSDTIDAKKTKPKEKTIDLRNENKNVVITLKVSSEYQLSVSEATALGQLYSQASSLLQRNLVRSFHYPH